MVFGISPTTLNSVYRYGKRAVKMVPDFAFGTGGEAFTNTLRSSFRGIKQADGKYVGGQGFKGFWSQLKNAFKASEAHNEQLIKTEGGFFKAMWKNIKNLPGDFTKAWTTGGNAAKAAGKSELWGSIKGGVKSLGGKMPLLGSLIYLATEIPNICTATWEGGLITGGGELVKASTRAAASVAGFGIGMAICPVCPIAGGIIAGIAADWLAGKIVGKSYTELKNEQQNKGLEGTKHFDTGSTNPFASGNADQYMLQQLMMNYANQAQGLNNTINY